MAHFNSKHFYGWLETSFFEGLLGDLQLVSQDLQKPNFLLTLFSSFLQRVLFLF